MELAEAKPGIAHGDLITFSISPQLSGYDAARTVALVDQLRERLGALPGVLGVGSSQIAVLTGTDIGGNITVEGRQNLDSDDRRVNYDAVSPNYFSTMRIPAAFGARIQRRRHSGGHESGDHQCRHGKGVLCEQESDRRALFGWAGK